MKLMFKRGGIGIFQGWVLGASFDVIGIDNAEEWGMSGINRFGSRRDFMEISIIPLFMKSMNSNLQLNPRVSLTL